MAMASCASEATAPYYPEQLMGDALQARAFPAASDEIGLWSGELDEQLVNGNGSLLVDDDSLVVGALVPADDDSEQHYSRGSSGGPAAKLCNTAAEHEQLTPAAAAASMALCLAYSGPTIRDIQKALSSRPNPSMARRHCGSLHLYGARSVTRGSRYTTTTVMRSCGGKMPTDGYKWRKYGHKFIKTKPHPRSYYKCTSSLCNAKKHVDRSTEDPEMFIVTYEGLHHHGPRPLSLAPAPKEYQGFRAAGNVHKPIMAKKKAWPSPMSSYDYNGADGNTRGRNNRLQGCQEGVHRGSTNSFMPRPADGVANSFSSYAQSAYWCCLDYRSFPEARHTNDKFTMHWWAVGEHQRV